MTNASMVVMVGVDAGHDDRGACEHDALDLAQRLGEATYVSVHVITEPAPHYAAVVETDVPVPRGLLAGLTGTCVAVTGDEPIEATSGLAAAVADHRARRSGRLICFPGQDQLRGTIPLAEVTARTAIDDIVCLGGAPRAGAVLRTQDFVRPIFRDGSIALVVQPFDGADEYVPFEQPNPHPCCGHH